MVSFEGEGMNVCKMEKNSHEDFLSILLSLVGHRHENEGKL
jgi:hypothetical protein